MNEQEGTFEETLHRLVVKQATAVRRERADGAASLQVTANALAMIAAANAKGDNAALDALLDGVGNYVAGQAVFYNKFTGMAAKKSGETK